MSRGRKKGGMKNHTEDRMARQLDNLRKYEDWRSTILPKLEAMLKDGAKPKAILEWAQSFAAAEMVSLALTETDPAKRLVALKDVLDRSMGKPKERHEHKHQYAELKDEELDAVLLSELEDVASETKSNH